MNQPFKAKAHETKIRRWTPFTPPQIAAHPALIPALTGGYLYPRLGVQLGPICEKMLNSVKADILIMGICGITKAGISGSNSLIVESLSAMIRAVRKVLIVADHT